MKQFMLDYAAQLERSGVDPASLMWFDVSDCAAEDFDLSVPTGKSTERLMKKTLSASMLDQPPPFPKCAFVGQFVRDGVEYSAFMAVVGDNPREDGVRVSCVRRAVSQSDLRSKYMTIPPVEYYIDKTGMLFSGYVEPVDENTWGKKELNSILTSLGSVYSHLSAGTAPITGYKPVARPGLINQKRKKKGKPLFYDWVTVNIEPPQPRSLPKGGTHASPRLHDRRGHFRTLRSGRKVWVRNHKVGDASKGTVFHDYVVS